MEAEIEAARRRVDAAEMAAVPHCELVPAAALWLRSRATNADCACLGSLCAAHDCGASCLPRQHPFIAVAAGRRKIPLWTSEP